MTEVAMDYTTLPCEELPKADNLFHAFILIKEVAYSLDRLNGRISNELNKQADPLKPSPPSLEMILTELPEELRKLAADMHETIDSIESKLF